MGSITSDEVNTLVYLYLKECGFAHAAFTFENECALKKRKLITRMVAATDGQSFPPGLLVSYLQRGLQFAQVERHVSDDGSEILDCHAPFSLLTLHECEGRRNPAIDMSIIPSPAAMIAKRKEQREAMLQKQQRSTTTVPYGMDKPRPATILNSHGTKIKKETEGHEMTTRVSTYDQEDTALGLHGIDIPEWTSSETLTLSGHGSEVFSCRWRRPPTITTPAVSSPISVTEETTSSLRMLATGSADGTLRLWDFHGNNSHSCKSLDMRATHIAADMNPEKQAVGVTVLDWDMSGERLAAGLYDGRVSVVSSSGHQLHMLTACQTPILAVKWSQPHGFLAAIASQAGLVIWDTVDWELRTCCSLASSSEDEEVSKAAGGDGSSILFTDMDWWPMGSDGSSMILCALAGTQGKLGLYHHDGTTSVFHELVGHTDDVNTVRWDSTGSLLASCSDDHTVRLWSIEITRTEKTKPFGFQLLGTVAIDADGSAYTLTWMKRAPEEAHLSTWLAHGTIEGIVKLWQVRKDVETRLPIVDHVVLCEAHESSVLALTFSPSFAGATESSHGRYLATVSSDHYLYVWPLPEVTTATPSSSQLQPVRRFAAKNCLYDVDWNHFDLATTSSDGSVYLIDTSQLLSCH